MVKSAYKSVSVEGYPYPKALNPIFKNKYQDLSDQLGIPYKSAGIRRRNYTTQELERAGAFDENYRVFYPRKVIGYPGYEKIAPGSTKRSTTMLTSLLAGLGLYSTYQ